MYEENNSGAKLNFPIASLQGDIFETGSSTLICFDTKTTPAEKKFRFFFLPLLLSEVVVH
jgi:hypothetical protein